MIWLFKQIYLFFIVFLFVIHILYPSLSLSERKMYIKIYVYTSEFIWCVFRVKLCVSNELYGYDYRTILRDIRNHSIYYYFKIYDEDNKMWAFFFSLLFIEMGPEPFILNATGLRWTLR